MVGQGKRIIRDETLFLVSTSLNTAYAESQRIIRGVNSLANNRLSPDLIKAKELRKGVEVIRRNLQAQGFELGISQYQEVFTCETSHLVYENGTIVVIVHLPAYKHNSQMRLLEFSGMPWSLPKLKTSVVLKSPQQLLAVTEDESMFRIVDTKSLDECTKTTNWYFCPNRNVYDKRIKSDCLMNLFTGDEKGISHNCVWSAAPAQDSVLQLGPNLFMIFHAEESGIRLRCPNSPEEFGSFQGVRILTIPSSCRAYTDAFVMDGQSEFSVSLDSFSARALNWTAVLQMHKFTPESFSAALTRLHSVGNSDDLTIAQARGKFDEDSSWRIYGWVVGLVMGATMMMMGIWISLRCCIGRMEFPLLWPQLRRFWNRCMGREDRADENMEMDQEFDDLDQAN